jgi:hypothetical protein
VKVNKLGKISGEINRKLQNSSEFHQIIKGIPLNREVPEQYLKHIALKHGTLEKEVKEKSWQWI